MAESDARANQKHVINFAWPYLFPFKLPEYICYKKIEYEERNDKTLWFI